MLITLSLLHPLLHSSLNNLIHISFITPFHLSLSSSLGLICWHWLSSVFFNLTGHFHSLFISFHVIFSFHFNFYSTVVIIMALYINPIPPINHHYVMNFALCTFYFILISLFVNCILVNVIGGQH
jgi:hypothetical protein